MDAYPSATHYENIDENQSTVDLNTYVGSDWLGDGEQDEFHMEDTTAAILEVTEIKIWIIGFSRFSTYDLSITNNGTDYTTETGINMGGWRASTFNVSWTKTDLNNLQVRIESNVVSGPPGSAFIRFMALYAEVTYTPIPPTIYQNCVLQNVIIS
jgi:hypothetical protein